MYKSDYVKCISTSSSSAFTSIFGFVSTAFGCEIIASEFVFSLNQQHLSSIIQTQKITQISARISIVIDKPCYFKCSYAKKLKPKNLAKCHYVVFMHFVLNFFCFII